jgi:hypothetical protein
MPKAPLALVKERFSSKEKLVAEVKALANDELWVGTRLNDDKGLDHVSNRKLLHLHDVLTQVKKDHGSRAKLIDAIVSSDKRVKDKEYRGGLERRSTPALFQILAAGKKRSKKSSD